MNPYDEQGLRDEVIYLHSLWHQGPPPPPPNPFHLPIRTLHHHAIPFSTPQPYIPQPLAPHFHPHPLPLHHHHQQQQQLQQRTFYPPTSARTRSLPPVTSTTFKKKNNKKNKGSSYSTSHNVVIPDPAQEWPCPASPDPPPRTGWGASKPLSDPPLAVSPQEKERLAALNLQHKACQAFKKFLFGSDGEDDDGGDDSEGDDNDEEELEKFFLGIFLEGDELRGYYQRCFESGEFCCLVCDAVGKKNSGKKFKDCAGLVQHSMSILRTVKKRAHRAFGQVVCKVMGWDIDRLPTIVMKGEPLGCSVEMKQAQEEGEPKENVAAADEGGKDGSHKTDNKVVALEHGDEPVEQNALVVDQSIGECSSKEGDNIDENMLDTGLENGGAGATFEDEPKEKVDDDGKDGNHKSDDKVVSSGHGDEPVEEHARGVDQSISECSSKEGNLNNNAVNLDEKMLDIELKNAGGGATDECSSKEGDIDENMLDTGFKNVGAKATYEVKHYARRKHTSLFHCGSFLLDEPKEKVDDDRKDGNHKSKDKVVSSGHGDEPVEEHARGVDQSINECSSKEGNLNNNAVNLDDKMLDIELKTAGGGAIDECSSKEGDIDENMLDTGFVNGGAGATYEDEPKVKVDDDGKDGNHKSDDNVVSSGHGDESVEEHARGVDQSISECSSKEGNLNNNAENLDEKMLDIELEKAGGGAIDECSSKEGDIDENMLDTGFVNGGAGATYEDEPKEKVDDDRKDGNHKSKDKVMSSGHDDEPVEEHARGVDQSISECSSKEGNLNNNAANLDEKMLDIELKNAGGGAIDEVHHESLASGAEWVCKIPTCDSSSTASEWPSFNTNSSSQICSPSAEEQERVAVLQIQHKALEACQEYLVGNAGSDCDDDNDDEDEDELIDYYDPEECEEFKFFLRLFTEDSDLRRYYENNHREGDFFCLVCGGIRKKIWKRFKDCIALLQHSTAIKRTKRKRAHRAYSQVICKVLGWDIDQLPAIVLKGESLGSSLASSRKLSVESEKTADGDIGDSNGKSKVPVSNPKRGKPSTQQKTSKGVRIGAKEKTCTQQNTKKGLTSCIVKSDSPIASQPFATQTNNPVEQLGILKNAHNMTMYMLEKTGRNMPPNLVEANKILHQLLGIAQEVTSGKQYDWKKVAHQLGVTHIEPYMTFFQHVDQAKQFCAGNEAGITAACEGRGTQQSEVTTTHGVQGIVDNNTKTHVGRR